MTKLLPRMFVFSLFLVLSIAPIADPSDLDAAETDTPKKAPVLEKATAEEPAQKVSEQAGEQSVATEEWEITADRIIRYEDPHSIVAEGNIVLIKRKQVPPKKTKASVAGLAAGEEVSDWNELLEEETVAEEEEELTPADLPEQTKPIYKTQATVKADWATYDIALNTIKARGNVSVQADGQYIFAEQAEINLEQETGTFRKATIIGEEKDMHLEGEVIEKIGFKTYHIEDGWIITCKIADDETAPWSFAASDVVIKQDGYAVLKHARFRIKDVPVFYSPYLVVPAKSKRETGFLLPEISSSQNGGFGFNLPFFWNISDSTDLTIYTQYFANRGYMPGAEFRYITSTTDKGMAMANYLYDELSDPSEVEYYNDTGFTHDNKDRYWFRAKADQNFGAWVTRLDLDIVSDRDYLTEFNTGFTGFKASNDDFLDTFGRSLENKTDDQRTNALGVQRSWGSTSLAAQMLGINDVRDLQDPVGGPPIPTPLWNLPAIDYTGTLPFEKLWDMTLQWDASYYNYWREEGIGGHRADIYPTLSAPLPISPYLESRAEIGLRETLYSVQTYGEAEWDEDDTQNRFLYDIHAELGTTLMRTFAISGEKITGLTHEVRPYVDYDFIPDVDQTDLPSFDGVDRISERNEIVYGIDNFINALTGDYDDDEYGWLKIKQSYSFLDENSDEPFSDINLRLKWYPLSQLEFDYETDFDVYDTGFVKHDFYTTYRNGRGDIFQLEYFFQDNTPEELENSSLIDTEQINALVDLQLAASFRIKAGIEHSIANDETNEANVSLIYQALCWSVELGSQYTPTDTSIMLMFNLANLGSPLRFYY